MTPAICGDDCNEVSAVLVVVGAPVAPAGEAVGTLPGAATAMAAMGPFRGGSGEALGEWTAGGGFEKGERTAKRVLCCFSLRALCPVRGCVCVCVLWLRFASKTERVVAVKPTNGGLCVCVCVCLYDEDRVRVGGREEARRAPRARESARRRRRRPRPPTPPLLPPHHLPLEPRDGPRHLDVPLALQPIAQGPLGLARPRLPGAQPRRGATAPAPPPPPRRAAAAASLPQRPAPSPLAPSTSPPLVRAQQRAPVRTRRAPGRAPGATAPSRRRAPRGRAHPCGQRRQAPAHGLQGGLRKSAGMILGGGGGGAGAGVLRTGSSAEEGGGGGAEGGARPAAATARRVQGASAAAAAAAAAF
jgi:hypothetical protein